LHKISISRVSGTNRKTSFIVKCHHI
jgi:hypothetical protein